jgi:O-antigen ligase
LSRRRVGRAQRIPPLWENLVFAHVAVFVVGLSWWFGGQSSGARQALLVWSTLGIGLFFFAWGSLRGTEHGVSPPWRLLWPLLLFDVLVVLSLFNPSTRLMLRGTEEFFVHITPRWPWLPSSARPDLSLRELWQFNGIVISCYNVYLVLHSRRLLRQLLSLVAANALALAVFGTFQKLTGSAGIWFGAVPTPQPYFFATFVYHNHWGAFTLLNLVACLGLLLHAVRQTRHRDFWHSPALLGSVAVLFIALTLPLSGSRSSSVLVALLLAGSLTHFLLKLIRRRRERHESILPQLAAILAAVALAVTGALYVSRDVIRARTELTARQLAEVRNSDTLNARLQLYGDTWRMAGEKPWYGWGLESYGDVFRIFNSQRPQEAWFEAPVYREAHNDWLQAIAEVGFVGTALIGALILAPLWSVRWWRLRSALPGYLLTGCAVVLLYAWLEFPFANPSVMLAFWLSIFVAARYARLDLIEQVEESSSAPHA